MEEEVNEVDMNQKDENEFHIFGYQLCNPSLDRAKMLASSYLQMPVGKTYNNVTWSFPKVVMDLKNLDDINCLGLMLTCNHKNILHAKIVTAENSCNVVWTEPFTGLLIDLLTQMSPYLGDLTGMVPSPDLQNIVSQWFDGIGHLRHRGNYHGDFRLENTYYHVLSGMPVVKFTNFRVKDGESLIDYQLEDVRAIARCLDGICSIAGQWNNAGRRPTWDCCLVMDLAKKLREVTQENLVSVMKGIRRHMFFWNKNDRTKFYAYDLASSLRTSDFRADVEASSSLCNLPWDSDQYNGLLHDMNNHRVLHDKNAYDGSKRVEFCAFCSGSYSHEAELPCVKIGRVLVDDVLQSRHPKACFELACMMPNRETKYMLSKREVQS